MFALGLYLLSHHLENSGANAIINKEFKTPNHEAGTSAISFPNSTDNIQIAIVQIIIKLIAKKIFESAYFEKVFLNNNHKTHVIIPNGIIVIRVFTILNIKAEFPSRTR